MSPGLYWFNPKKDKHYSKELPKRKTLVHVISHVYSVDGRLSNSVRFTVVQKNGLMGETLGTYDFGQFEPANAYTLMVRKIKSVKKGQKRL